MRALLIVLLLAACDATGPEPLGIIGDVSGDMKVNVIDAQQISRWAAGLSVSDTVRVLRCGDVDGNGVVTQEDAIEVARYSVGLPTFASIGQPCW